MNEFYEAAIAKLNDLDENKLDRYGRVVYKDVKATLVDFCQKYSEFSQAVAQSDKTFADCINACTKNCGSAISDLEVFNRAVDFWFSGAKIRLEKALDLGDGGFSNDKKEISLSLDSLFDF